VVCFRETCENGTLVELKKQVEKKGMTFSCTDDPKSVTSDCAKHYILAEIVLSNLSANQIGFYRWALKESRNIWLSSRFSREMGISDLTSYCHILSAVA